MADVFSMCAWLFAAFTMVCALGELGGLMRRLNRRQAELDESTSKHVNGLDSLTIEQLQTVKDEIVALGTGGNSYVPTAGGSPTRLTTRNDNPRIDYRTRFCHSNPKPTTGRPGPGATKI